ncbi:MAG: CopG family transcriptional regulator [Myxococcota bacterium]
MAGSVKFSSKMRPEVLEALRKHAAESDRTLASVLNDAAEQYLARARVRPAFRQAAEQVMDEHAELLERLAR